MKHSLNKIQDKIAKIVIETQEPELSYYAFTTLYRWFLGLRQELREECESCVLKTHVPEMCKYCQTKEILGE